jgi:hypothetical protein
MPLFSAGRFWLKRLTGEGNNPNSLYDRLELALRVFVSANKYDQEGRPAPLTFGVSTRAELRCEKSMMSSWEH